MYTLKQARQLKGLTQKQAAELLEISLPTLYNYEIGVYSPTIPILKRIEQVYEVRYENIDWGIK